MIKRPIHAIGALLICGSMMCAAPMSALAASQILAGPGQEGKFMLTVQAESVDIVKDQNESEVLTQALKGASFQVMEETDDGWMKVQVGSEQGYVKKSDGVSVLSPEEAEAQKQAAQEAAASASNRRQDLVNYALQFVGCRYTAAGNSPATGFDCSGFTRYVMQNGAGVSLNRSSTSQSVQGVPVDASQMRPGDLIFYGSGRSINHVAVYIGNGQIVHASTYKTGVKTSNWNYRTPVKIINVLGD